MTLSLELIGVGLLILLNAFFVAAEYGLVTARRTRIIELQHEGNKRARATSCGSRPTRGGSSPRCSSASRSPPWESVRSARRRCRASSTSGWPPSLAIILAYAILTFFHVVAGELVPKGAALGHPGGDGALGLAPGARLLRRLRPGHLAAAAGDRRDPPGRSASSRRARSARSTPKPSCGCSSPARRRKARSSTASAS